MARQKLRMHCRWAAPAFAVVLGALGSEPAFADEEGRAISGVGDLDRFVDRFLEIATRREYDDAVHPIVRWDRPSARVAVVFEPRHGGAVADALAPAMEAMRDRIEVETGFRYDFPTDFTDDAPPDVIVIFGTPGEIAPLASMVEDQLGIAGLTDILGRQEDAGLPACAIGAEWQPGGPIVRVALTVEIGPYVEKCVAENFTQSLGFFADPASDVVSVLNDDLSSDQVTNFDRLAMRVLYSNDMPVGGELTADTVRDLAARILAADE